jgi:hypothetical protein
MDFWTAEASTTGAGIVGILMKAVSTGRVVVA